MGPKEEVYNHVCTVSARLSVSDGADLEGTCSGILIDTSQGLILSHASMLYSMFDNMRREKINSLRRTGIAMGKNMFDSAVTFTVILPNVSEESCLEKEKNRNLLPALLNADAQDLAPFASYNCHLKSIFECKSLRRTLERVTPKDTWQFSEDASDYGEQNSSSDQQVKKSSGQNDDAQYFLLPCFVLLKLKGFQTSNLCGLSVKSSLHNRQGDPVEICATPFGGLTPEVFLNSCSRGIISSLAGPRGVLIMTDARCIPGSEGGALFFCQNKKRILTGMMIATLCWKNVEWVGLSLACAISEILGSLKGYLTLKPNVTTPAIGYSTSADLVSKLRQHVCCVQVGHSWGSGVCVDPVHQIYITCSHVLRGDHLHSVSIRTGGRRGLSCEVLYRTPLGRQFDLALVKASAKDTLESNQDSSQSVSSEKSTNQNQNREEQSLPIGHVREGDVVYVIGHALFRDSLNLPPMVTTGVVSKILKHNRVPVMIQTTCAVHAGASGGGVFNTRGQLVAMAVCNSKDTTSGASYPHVNMCVPMAAIAPSIREFLSTGDPVSLEALHIKSNRISQLWSLGDSSSAILTSQL